MLDSLRDLCRATVSCYKQAEHSITGDITFGAPISLPCYPVEQSEVIRDKTGKEYITRSTYYIPGECDISDTDFIEYNGEPCEIRKLAAYYDGTTGAISVWVCYI